MLEIKNPHGGLNRRLTVVVEYAHLKLEMDHQCIHVHVCKIFSIKINLQHLLFIFYSEQTFQLHPYMYDLLSFPHGSPREDPGDKVAVFVDYKKQLYKFAKTLFFAVQTPLEMQTKQSSFKESNKCVTSWNQATACNLRPTLITNMSITLMSRT